MPKTIRNEFYKCLTYEKLMEAHLNSRKGKGTRKEIILFNLKQEEYIKYLLEQLQTKQYKHGGYTTFYVTEPKVRKIEKSIYLDRVVHRWLVDNILSPVKAPKKVVDNFNTGAKKEEIRLRYLFFIWLTDMREANEAGC